MELWHRLSNTVDLLEVRHLLDHQHEIWASKYDKFIEAMMAFVKREIHDFRRSIMSMDDSFRDYQIYLTRAREFVQATSQRMDSIQPQVTSIRSDLEEHVDRAAHLMKTELRSEFQAALDKKAVLLET